MKTALMKTTFEDNYFVSAVALACFVAIALAMLVTKTFHHLWHLVPPRIRTFLRYGGKSFFIRRYCRANQLDWKFGRHNHRVVKCDCGAEDCEGYRMEGKDPRWK